MNYDLEKMTPKDIEKLIVFLEEILGRKVLDKKTMSQVIKEEKANTNCPYCGSENNIKYGFTNEKIQRYKCKECNVTYTDTTNSVCYRSKLTFEKWKIFFECMSDKLSLRKTAAKMGVDKNTVFSMRHKVLNSLKKFRKDTKLSGKTEADEVSIPINFKGQFEGEMPRSSKKRKSASKKVNHKVCILGAIDENDNVYLSIVGNGEITSEIIKKELGAINKDINLLVTDCRSAYESFAKENNIKLEQVKSKTYKNNNGYTLSEINGLHSNFFGFLAPFKGVSTKHLQGYIDWFVFQKYINYTVEIMNHPSEIFDYVIKQNSRMTIKEIYNKPFPFDVTEAYKDYIQQH